MDSAERGSGPVSGTLTTRNSLPEGADLTLADYNFRRGRVGHNEQETALKVGSDLFDPAHVDQARTIRLRQANRRLRVSPGFARDLRLGTVGILQEFLAGQGGFENAVKGLFKLPWRTALDNAAIALENRGLSRAEPLSRPAPPASPGRPCRPLLYQPGPRRPATLHIQSA